ncbi:ATP-dependent protease La [Aaosphaeria arxii CBS 175.79]|uniref:Lon protease homolog, mitochondrial n=1 Tax=Aaosphaeria arxii CBS 175.79 TaxID=1450172 RepID=A0A6A5Y190_9PLEO|nr:ATP-dependent protease La [Aaosphaeria arxii CBS 175.79]KAF2019242.1 ATP-dependent protease La [Aaosphaeria arxii CBS 175.79]
MLQGQRLTWRAALRHVPRSGASLSASRATTSLRPSQYTASSLTQYPRRCPSPPVALFASRSFSTTLSRHKERDPKSIPDPQEEVKDEESEEQKKIQEETKEVEGKSKSPEPIPSSNSSNARGSAAGEGGSSGGDGGSGKKKKTSERSLVKPSIPEVYPQVMAIPIGKRPLFPGFYKAITIRNKEVGQAIADMVKRGQPYIGAFLLKDDDADKDVIDDPNEVYDVGTFCQVTSAFPVGPDDNFAMTCVLYPHRRIKMTDLKPPAADKAPETPQSEPSVVESTLGEDAVKESTPQQTETEAEQSKGDVVASFEEGSADAEKAPQYYEATSFLKDRKVSIANVENLMEEPFDIKNNRTIPALVSEIVNTFKAVALLNPLFRDHISTFSVQTTMNVGEDPVKLADFAAAVAQADSHELQEALEEMNVEQRLSKALIVLKKELMNAELQSKIVKDVETKIHKKQREYWLMEQMKGIKRELGIESDGKDKLIERFNEKATKLAMPEAVKKVFDEEISKLSHLEPAASEFNVTRNYLDWLTQLPWGQRSAENFGIKHAREVLDEDHYGLKDVKDRILEFIAVGKLRGTVEGKILCMVGPPGVGKTSIGKSVARALNRQYYRFSVGGLSDVAEIKGHRRTYVGALPGRIIQALKKCQTENPLILIDEVDKIGRGHNGDPASALLELLDPEQNSSFLDHYLDVPVDLSKVLFVCTANMTDTIPRPLLDRMEMIELSGYVADEKMAIAERYLAPTAKETNGLKDVDVILEKEAIVELINKYCRESGVRNLKKQIEKVYRKSALKIVTDLGEEAFPESEALTEEGKAAQKESEKDTSDVKETPETIENETTEVPRVALKVPDSVHVSINKDNLKDYVGPPVFTSDRLYDTTPPGVAMGLAWTSMGGAALYVESILESALSANSHAGLERTGSLKNVMKESTTVAYSFAKGLVAREFPKNKFFEHARIHLHCPEGAVPKDGPSAGITMATSLLSLAFNKQLQTTIAMTGELTVTGKVLRIGGLREKTVAARRAGATMVIFPQDNMSDWLELPENIKEGIEGKPVSWYSEVFSLVFPDLDRDAANKLWEKELKGKKGDKKKYKEKARKEEEEEESGEDDD